MHKLLITAAALGALAVPTSAQAASLAYSGDTLVLKAGSGEENFVTFGSEEAGKLSISDSGATYTLPPGCTQIDPQYSIHCTAPAKLVADFGDADDTIVVGHMVPEGMQVAVAGGDGTDSIKAIGGNTVLLADGGAGNDELRSEEGGDILRGGAGDDELLGNTGADVLEGGEGDDTLTGDACGTPAGDVLDGGAGHDTLTDWGQCGSTPDPRPITVTVNGVADDGRPGEGDDVRDLDVLELFVPATVTGTDEADSIAIYAPDGGTPSSIYGRGGDDYLKAGSGSASFIGGAGRDTIEGGHGHDTVDARDGEADVVACGAGEDRVTADAKDTVAADCETVDGAKAASITAQVRGRVLKVRLSGFAPGPLKVTARAGGRKIASARTTVKANGTAAVRLQLTRKSKGRAISVTAGGATVEVK